nr:hypothetical protein CFP56_22180 [Quercus suber]
MQPFAHLNDYVEPPSLKKSIVILRRSQLARKMSIALLQSLCIVCTLRCSRLIVQLLAQAEVGLPTPRLIDAEFLVTAGEGTALIGRLDYFELCAHDMGMHKSRVVESASWHLIL